MLDLGLHIYIVLYNLGGSQRPRYEAGGSRANRIGLRTPCPPVLLEHVDDAFRHKVPVDSFIPPAEQDAIEAVKLFELDGRRRVPRCNADDTTLNHRCRPEVVFANIHDVVD